MKVMVPWSGGLDSTSLVVWNLEQGNTVVAPYFQIDNNETKVVMEKKTRDVFREHQYFKRFIDRGRLIVTDCSPKVYLCCGNPMGLALTQPAIWLLSMLYTVDSTIDEVQLAYVMNDCALSWLNEIEAIWAAYDGLVHKGKLPKLTFPYIKKSKHGVCEILNGADYTIAELTWSCEMPIGEKVCGTCVPCIRREHDCVPTAYHYKESVETVAVDVYGSIDKVDIIGTVSLGDTPEKETCDGHCKVCKGCEESEDNVIPTGRLINDNA